jgi:hypothetical protein
MVLPKQTPSRAYVLLVAGQETEHTEYRDRRAALLAAYCQVAKLEHPYLLDVAGIATEPLDYDSRSEDLVYLDGRLWDETAQEDARELKRNAGLMTNISRVDYHDQEYPAASQPTSERRTNRNKKRKAIKERRQKWKI